MSLSGILTYSLRAGAFALAVCGVYAVFCRLRGRIIVKRRMAAVFYVAALAQITVLRGGVDWQAVLRGTRSLPQMVPLGTVIALPGDGLWNLVYNIVGNLIWFVPLGMLLGRKTWLQALLIGSLVSAGIELLQYILVTGTTDIDDVILNAIGSLAGWAIYQVYKQRRCR